MTFEEKLSVLLQKIEGSILPQNEKDELIAVVIGTIQTAIPLLLVHHIKQSDLNHVVSHIKENPRDLMVLVKNTITDPLVLENIETTLLTMLDKADEELNKSNI